jgi:hypothetical protein
LISSQHSWAGCVKARQQRSPSNSDPPPMREGRRRGDGRVRRRAVGCSISSSRCFATPVCTKTTSFPQAYLNSAIPVAGVAPDRYLPLRNRPNDVGSRRELSSRRLTTSTSRHELLSQHRHRESNAHRDANALRVGDHLLERLGAGKSASLAAQPGTGLGRRMCHCLSQGRLAYLCVVVT